MCEHPYPCKYIEKVFIDEKSDEYKKYCAFGKKRSVTKEKVIKKFYDNHLFRKSLTCKISDKGESIVVILMNPSYADEDNLDSTLNNVKKYLEQNGYAKFEVLNIFPIRMPNSKNVDGLMKKYDNKKGDYQKGNDKYIESLLENKENKNILIAWGSKYHKHAQWLLEYPEFSKFSKDKNLNLWVYRLNADGSPSHFAPQVFNRYGKENREMEKIEIDTEKKCFKYRKD